MALVCPLCSIMNFENVSALLRHVRLTHADRPDFMLQCNLQGCCRTFRNFSTYRNHMYTFHGSGTLAGNQSEVATTEETMDDQDSNSILEMDITNSSEITKEPTSQLQEAAATWILKIREMHRLPLSVMDTIMCDLETLVQAALGFVEKNVTTRLREAHVSEALIHSITDEISTASTQLHIFRGLKSQHQQENYFRSKFNLVEPIQILLGRRQRIEGTGVRRRFVTKKECMVYIPILKSLEVLLNNDTVLSEIENGHTSNSSALKDYCDGEIFTSHPLFSIDATSLQILFYYDEIEICNPIGSSRSKHKLGMFYFLLGNLRPRYRSKTKVIQLAAICKYKFIKKYRMAVVLKPIVKDLLTLEQGHDFTVQGRTKHIRGTIALVSADNPASAALGGFKESTSALRPCRQCTGLATDIKEMFSEGDFELRELDQHCAEVEEVEDDDTGEKSKEYGINYRSPLLSLNYSDLCSGVLLPDVMHDILEGTLQHELKLLLQHCICTHSYFQLSVLNTKIESSELGYMETDRPAVIARETLISGDHRLKQKATQAWVLCRLVPVMVGEHVPDDDENWLNYLLMLEISDYLFAPIISADEAAYLSVLIEEHHSKFKNLYSSASVIPKMHFLIHTPRLIVKFGPLVRHWTMRYEAKHSYFKKLAQNVGNFKNISLTLAKRHQYLQCYQHLNKQALFQENPEVGPGMPLSTAERPDLLQDEELECYRANWIKVHGVTYKKFCALCTGVDDDDLPIFVKVLEIYMLQQQRPVAHTQLYSSTGFNTHYHAYEISQTSEYKIIPLEYLEHPHPLQIRKLPNGVSAIVPKYHIHKTLQSCYC